MSSYIHHYSDASKNLFKQTTGDDLQLNFEEFRNICCGIQTGTDMSKAIDWLRDEIINKYDQEGCILSHDELQNQKTKYSIKRYSVTR